MSKGDLLEFDGQLSEAQGGGQYLITLEEGSKIIRATLSGKMKQNKIRVIHGDKVRVAVSPYDISHGLIIKRYK